MAPKTIVENIFSEICSTWKDGCIAFSSEHIQISKYYLDGPDSKPYQKCKVTKHCDLTGTLSYILRIYRCFTDFFSQVLSTRKPFFNQYHYNKISIGPRDVENIKLDETSLMVMIDTKYRQLDNVLLKFQTMVSHYVIILLNYVIKGVTLCGKEVQVILSSSLTLLISYKTGFSE